MNGNLFHGELVRLATEESQTLAEAVAKWGRDTEYGRLLDSNAARAFSVKAVKDWLEKDLAKENPNSFDFSIRNLVDDRLVGFISLNDINWTHGDTFVGIGLGEREYWGKGFGTDAMRVILRYAFTELNLRRV